GGIFTAEQAKKYGLIDEIGYLEEAIKAARQAASLGDDYRAVLYQRPPSLFGSLFGARSLPPGLTFSPVQLSQAALPRLWYLAPQADLAGQLAVMGGREDDR